MDKIKVSVIIPVYNEPELVTRALESIPERKDIRFAEFIKKEREEGTQAIKEENE